MSDNPETPAKLAENEQVLIQRAVVLWQVQRRLEPDDWARANRTYPASAGVPGPREPSLTPYKIDFARAVASGRYKRIVDVSAAQMGKSETELDIIGHRLDQKPAPILFVGPNKQFVTEQFEPRIMALLDQAPVLMRKVARGKKMTKTRKMVAGVPLRLAHGGSSTALKSDPAALAIIDEYDELLANVKGQGDPLGLVEARGDTYADFTVAITSTPSLGTTKVKRDPQSGLDFWQVVAGEEIESPIWKLWQQGTRHHWAWKCPHCAQWFIPRFELLRWPKDSTPHDVLESAYMLCGHDDCGGIIEERHKRAMNDGGLMIAPGQWIDDKDTLCGEPEPNSTASFWSSGLCSPFVTFGQRAESYLLAVRSGDHGKTQAVINAGFGELWSPGGGELPELAEVHALKVPYRLGDVPSGVVILTAGVDVQKNRLVYVVRGWGARGTSWLISHGELWGQTAEPEVWMALEDVMQETFSGLPIRLTIIDSGFRPNKDNAGSESIVYDYCRRHQRNARPSKGVDYLASGALTISKIEIEPKGGRAKYGLELVRINTDWCKLWVHERIRWPQDQPGAFFLPSDVSDDYCQQLLSEARMKTKAGRAQWIKRTRDNHYLDCEAMAYAAGYMLNVHRIPATERATFVERPRNEEGEPETRKPETVELKVAKAVPSVKQRPRGPIPSKYLSR